HGYRDRFSRKDEPRRHCRAGLANLRDRFGDCVAGSGEGLRLSRRTADEGNRQGRTDALRSQSGEARASDRGRCRASRKSSLLSNLSSGCLLRVEVRTSPGSLSGKLFRRQPDGRPMKKTAKQSWKKGSCHCGTVSFEVLAPDEIEIVNCNCSMCARTGYLH